MTPLTNDPINLPENVEMQKAYFWSLLSASPDIIIITDLTGKIMIVSPRALTILGYEHENEIIHKNIMDFVHDEGREKAYQGLTRMFKGDFHGAEEYLARKKDGSILDIEVNGHFILDDLGKPAQMIFVIRDISKRKESEFKYIRLFENMAQGVVYQDANGYIINANPAACEILGLSLDQMQGKKSTDPDWKTVRNDGSFYPGNEHPAMLALKTGKSILNEVMGVFNPIIKKYTWILVSAVPEFKPDNEKPFRVFATFTNITKEKEAEFLLSEQIKKSELLMNNLTGVVFRCKIDDDWTMEFLSHGVFELTGYRAEEFLNNRVISFGKIIHPDDSKRVAEIILSSIRTQKKYSLEYRVFSKDGNVKWVWENGQIIFENNEPIAIEGFISDITEKKAAEGKLIASEARYKSFFEGNKSIMLLIDSKTGKIMDANPAAVEYYGHSRQQICTMNIGDINTLTDQELKEEMRNAFEQKRKHFIFKHKLASGEIRDVEVYSGPMIWDNTDYLYSIVHDITTRKKAEDELRKLSRAVEQSPVSIVITSAEGIIEYVNPKACQSTGYTLDELIGKKPSVIKSGETDQVEYAKLWETISSGREWQGIFHNKRKNGDLYWESSSISPVINPDGIITHYLAVKLDITQEVMAKEEIKRLNIAIEQSPISILITDLDAKIVYASTSFYKITGYEPQEILGQNVSILKSGLTPRETYENLWNTITSDKVWKGEWSNRKKNGTFYWEQISITPIFDTKGNKTGYLAIKEDITERKHQEEEILQLNLTLEERIIQRTAELEETNQNLLYQIKERELVEAELLLKTTELETFFTVSLDLLAIANLDGRFIKVNRSFTDIFGYSEEEFLSAPFFEFMHPDDVQTTKNALTVLAENKPVHNFVNRYRTKSGDYHFVEWNSYPAGDLIYTAARDITSRIESDQLLQQTRYNYETFFNTIDDFLWVLDTEGNIIHTNQTVTKRLEYEDFELKSKSVLLVHPEQRRDEAARIVMEMLEGTADFCPVPVVTKSGKSIPVETRVKPGYWNGVPVIFGVSKDISAIQLSEQKFSSAFQVNPALMAISNFETGVFIDVNNAFLDILGFVKQEIIGKTNMDVDLLENPGILTDFMNEVNSGDAVKRREIGMKTKSGAIRTGLLSAEIIYIGALKCLLTITVDITERKIAEEALVKARKEADLANQAKSEFLSRMSHELRTPLNSILGFAQLLEMTEIPPNQKKDVRHIMKSGWHLLDLINEVLDISKIEAGKLVLSIEPVQLESMIHEMVDFVKTQANAKYLTIEIDPGITSELHLLADKQRTKQILLNLINNSIKYNKDGGNIKIRADYGSQSASGLPLVRVSIIDSGYGIPAESLGKLFQPFERIGAEKTTVEGTGLGLTVVKKLVDAMGGRVGVESIYGQGSTFWFELPITELLLIPHRNTDALNPNAPDAETYDGKILYIEDNPYNVVLVEQILAMQRPSIKMTSNSFGSHALNLARLHKPDLILLDLDLPDMHGSEVFKELQANDETAGIPVMVISSDATPSQIDKLLTSGVKKYLTKPIKVLEFLNALDEFIKPKNG